MNEASYRARHRDGSYRTLWDRGEISWSATAKAIFGLPAETRMTPEVVLERVHPEDRDLVVRATADSWNPEIDGLFEVEHRVRWPDGTLRWVAARGRARFAESPEGSRPIRHTGVHHRGVE